jgi:hypothetical protein
VRILCGGAQCGEYLGDVGPSVVQRNPNPVWYIRQGWKWVFPPGTRGEPLGRGILERADDTGRAERRLIHEVYSVQSIDDHRVGVQRETNLPVVVRCPKCHRLRYVPADVVTRAIQPVQSRLIQIVRS